VKFLGLGLLIPGAILAGYILGMWFDRLFHTQFLYIVFVILGAVVGLFAMVREAKIK
jgi:F0F1-type ATP synthase assembly protein I